MSIQLIWMHIAYTLAIWLFLLLAYVLTSKVCKVNHEQKVALSLSAMGAIAISISTHYISQVTGIYLCMIVVGIIYFKIIHKINILQASCMTMFFILHVSLVKAFILGIMSTVLSKTSMYILTNEANKTFSIVLSQAFVCILIYLYIRFIDVKEIRSLLLNKRQMQKATTSFAIILGFSIFISDSLYLNDFNQWFFFFNILSSISLYAVSMLILDYSAKISTLIQHTMQDQKQMETIQLQMRQQNSISMMMETINTFKHDFKESMLMIENYIDTGCYSNAVEVVKNDCMSLLKTLPQAKKYSNNIILNSLFIDRQIECDQNGIQLDVLFYCPESMKIGNREFHEMFRILTQYAIHENLKIPKEHRFIRIKSSIENKWLKVIVESPYSGELRLKVDSSILAYEREEHESLGYLFVEELLEEHNGILQLEDYEDQGTFKVAVLLRIDEEESQSKNK